MIDLEWKKKLSELPHEEFLEGLDDWGDGWYYIHEAARRIRELLKIVESPTPTASSERSMRFCPECHGQIVPRCNCD